MALEKSDGFVAPFWPRPKGSPWTGTVSLSSHALAPTPIDVDMGTLKMSDHSNVVEAHSSNTTTELVARSAASADA
jgi:hypothetical protein